jgi:hypothetical protein
MFYGDFITSATITHLHVLCQMVLSDFNQTWSVWSYKSPVRLLGAVVIYAERQMDMKLISGLRACENASKNGWTVRRCTVFYTKLKESWNSSS